MENARRWGWFLGLGIVLIVLGIVALSDVLLVTLASIAVVGWLLVIGGIVQLAHAIRTQGQGWSGVMLNLLAGILYIVVGLMLVANPLAGAAGLTLLAAMFLFVLGLFRISVAAMLPLPARGWMLIAGGALLAIGLGLRHHFGLVGDAEQEQRYRPPAA